jgi:branched-chain amino acid transport system substrate-binding protein
MWRSLIPLLVIVGLSGSALAQSSGNKVVIGILGDQSGVVADVGGRGSVLAARMAVADFGGTVLGKQIEIRDADHQHKVDVASSIAREWFDVGGVDAIADLPNTGAVLALQEMRGRERRRC